jgi:hypothetical protein
LSSAPHTPADPVEAVREDRDVERTLPADPFRLIRQADLFERMAVSDATGHRLRAAGKVGPRPVRLSGVRFYLPEVLAWLQHRRPDGSLHDARTWPAVWAQLQSRSGG